MQYENWSSEYPLEWGMIRWGGGTLDAMFGEVGCMVVWSTSWIEATFNGTLILKKKKIHPKNYKLIN